MITKPNHIATLLVLTVLERKNGANQKWGQETVEHDHQTESYCNTSGYVAQGQLNEVMQGVDKHFEMLRWILHVAAKSSD
eukprot:3411682-Amphidinium_carterae.1